MSEPIDPNEIPVHQGSESEQTPAAPAAAGSEETSAAQEREAASTPSFGVNGDDTGKNIGIIVAMVVGLIAIGALIWWSMKGRTAANAPAAASVASAPSATSDPVLVKVDDMEIHQSEFEAALESIPEQMKQAVQLPAGRKQLAEELIKLKLLEREGKKLGVENNPKVKGQISLMTGNIIANATIERLMSTQAGGDLQQLYESNKADFQTAKARQILIAYEGGMVKPRSGKALSEAQAVEKAKALVARLRGGADFTAVAKQESDEPSVAKTGGEMGEIGRKMLPPDLDKALFALEVNQVTDPVTTNFGVHILELTDKQTKSFEEVKPMLEQQGSQLRTRNLIDDLRKKANVEFTGAFLGPQSTPGLMPGAAAQPQGEKQ